MVKNVENAQHDNGETQQRRHPATANRLVKRRHRHDPRRRCRQENERHYQNEADQVERRKIIGGAAIADRRTESCDGIPKRQKRDGAHQYKLADAPSRRNCHAAIIGEL